MCHKFLAFGGILEQGDHLDDSEKEDGGEDERADGQFKEGLAPRRCGNGVGQVHGEAPGCANE